MDQIWVVGAHDPLKSLVMGPSLRGTCYLEYKFRKVNPPPPLKEYNSTRGLVATIRALQSLDVEMLR